MTGNALSYPEYVMHLDQATMRVAPQSGTSFKLRAGDLLRVYDPLGEQVADLFAFRDGDLACSLGPSARFV